jgi:hypothetical protein
MLLKGVVTRKIPGQYNKRTPARHHTEEINKLVQ